MKKPPRPHSSSSLPSEEEIFNHTKIRVWAFLRKRFPGRTADAFRARADCLSSAFCSLDSIRRQVYLGNGLYRDVFEMSHAPGEVPDESRWPQAEKMYRRMSEMAERSGKGLAALKAKRQSILDTRSARKRAALELEDFVSEVFDERNILTAYLGSLPLLKDQIEKGLPGIELPELFTPYRVYDSAPHPRERRQRWENLIQSQKTASRAKQ